MSATNLGQALPRIEVSSVALQGRFELRSRFAPPPETNEGISEWERGLVLNHAEGSVTAGYSHGFATDRKRELLEMWENHVKSLVAPDGVESLYG